MNDPNDSEGNKQDSLDLRVRAISEKIARVPTEWRGDKVVTAEKTVPFLVRGLAVTLKGEITQEGALYKYRLEVICLPMASKHEGEKLVSSLDEAKEKIIKSWSAEALVLDMFWTPDEAKEKIIKASFVEASDLDMCWRPPWTRPTAKRKKVSDGLPIPPRCWVCHGSGRQRSGGGGYQACRACGGSGR